MQDKVRAFLNGLRIAQQSLCFVAFLVMGGCLIYDVLKREITGSGAFGAPQVGVVGMIVVSYIGIGLASAAGSHYRPRFFDHLFPKKYDALLDRIGEFGFAAFCAFLTYIAIRVTIESYDLADVSPVLRWPIWPVQSTIAIGFALVAIRHFFYGLYLEVRPQQQGGAAGELSSDPEAQKLLQDIETSRATAGTGPRP